MTAKKLQKPKFVPVQSYCDDNGLRVRDYERHGEENAALVTIKTNGTSDEDKQSLIKLVKATGLKMVCQGKERKRYFCGNCHWMVVFKRKDFSKARAKVVPEPEEKFEPRQQPKAPPRPVERSVSGYDPDEDEDNGDDYENNYGSQETGGSPKNQGDNADIFGVLTKRMDSMDAKFDKLFAMLQKRK